MSAEVTAKIQQKARAAQEEFISTRAMLEKDVESFSERLKRTPKELISHIGLPSTIECRSIFPSLYGETFVKENFEVEKDRFVTVLKQVDEVRNNLIKEAEEMLNG